MFTEIFFLVVHFSSTALFHRKKTGTRFSRLIKKLRQSIITRIKSCAQCWCGKHVVATSSFSERKQVLISAIDEQVSHLSAKLTTEKSNNTLQLKDKIITEELKKLHNKLFLSILIRLEVMLWLPLSGKGIMLKV